MKHDFIGLPARHYSIHVSPPNIVYRYNHAAGFIMLTEDLNLNFNNAVFRGCAGLTQNHHVFALGI